MTTGLASDTGQFDIPPGLRDGYEVHAAALRRGFDVLLLPRQLLMATDPATGVELAFVHGIPSSSNLSAVTFAQDKHMRRELLSRAGLPVPEGATFSLRRRNQAKKFARQVGYPVVVKPNIGDNLVEVFPGIASDEQLDEVIEYFQTPEAARPAHSRSAYSLTMLGEPGEEDGRAVAPQSYQFLIERHVRGQYLRLLMISGSTHSILHFPDGPRSHAGIASVPIDQVHPSLVSSAARAADVIPGLAVAAVDLVVQDYRKPTTSQEVWIVELSERPWLSAHAAVAGHLSQDAGDTIITSYATSQGLKAAAPLAADVTVSMRIEGCTDASAAIPTLSTAAAARGVTVTATAIDQIEGTVDGNLQGPPADIAGLCEILLDGRLTGQRAMLAQVAHQRK